MDILYSLVRVLPLLLAIALYAAFVKLAARIYRRSQLAWKHAFVFTLMCIVVAGLSKYLSMLTGHAFLAGLVAILGTGIQVALGAWFLGSRARTASGAPVLPRGGAIIAGMAVVGVLILAIIASVALPALLQRGQT